MRWQKSYSDQNHTSWEETEYGIINEITITFHITFTSHFCIYSCISAFLLFFLPFCINFCISAFLFTFRWIDAEFSSYAVAAILHLAKAIHGWWKPHCEASETKWLHQRRMSSKSIRIIWFQHMFINIYIYIIYWYHIYIHIICISYSHIYHKMISFRSAKGDWKQEETDTKRKRKWENERLHKKRKHSWLASA